MHFRLGAAMAAALAVSTLAQAQTPPALPREFRGVWVATVDNIDWPSRKGLPVAEQKKELLAIIDRARNANLNAIVLQVRPMADALYASKKEPWSPFLTGKMGQAPNPLWDPLAFAVEESHKRGMELHAWINPYRARPAGASVGFSPDHITQTRPDLAKRYGKSYWLDPGEPEAARHSLDVAMDIVKRYDIDGLHMDDYFYPYAESDSSGNDLDFPDEPSWKKYQASGGTLARDDWRRDNVNRFVQTLYREMKQAKPWVKLGISPFGIYRPGYPSQIKGMDQYSQLYADPLKWLTEGWCDYMAPQLYWRIQQTPQSFPVLLSWWTQNNPQRRHLWPGLFTSKGVGDPWPMTEIEYQIRTTRGFAGAGGVIHFSMKSLMSGSVSDQGQSLVGRLRATVYDSYALTPASPWLSTQGPDPALEPKLADGVASWKLPPTGAPRFWALQFRVGENWNLVVVPGSRLSQNAPHGADAVAIRAIDKAGVASETMAAKAR
ncbi:MAG: family 10 glycosylhydrolase [Armatimonas sp.]